MSIKSILIANRGEIAIRIVRTCKIMGIETWGIKTSAEPTAHYLTHVDKIFDMSDEYPEVLVFLDVEKLMNIIKETGVDGVHPGYGFLAENAYFAQRCISEGVKFIGPSPDVIHKMGNKTVARQIATKHDIPLASGTTHTIRDAAEAKKVADKIGYPVIIKAASGGGGRGMRIIHKAEELAQMFRLATNEAEKAFNDPSVFIEKYIQNPKHIEFQILADSHGNVVHLGERECSIQRKHQKLIEEAPSPALTPELRKIMGDTAVRIAEIVKYESAGTVEFLLDQNNDFYFMEMNTRIQVEHPVTEMITGIDLIKEQIRVANGEKLTVTQKDIKLNGWAIECRINAEDVQARFSPYLGTIEKMVLPVGENIRVDSGVIEGDSISPNFDSMIAKLIVWGEDRQTAIKETKKALNKLWIKGLKTTTPFFKTVLNNESFNCGTFTTSFIETELEVMHESNEEEEVLAAWFATLKYIDEREKDTLDQVDYEQGKNINPWVLNKRLKSF
ncbi:MAG: acetyl-CoA carboxylase biotin carboxylase subunit [Salinivirgaceae bacterium]|jgi:acetyl-CoA carboxylase biotin carboxylase subunit|nr:acetyl-CoA carboxylase biotin carboxylase subunit [Salinivirgaceae bacterium]